MAPLEDLTMADSNRGADIGAMLKSDGEMYAQMQSFSQSSSGGIIQSFQGGLRRENPKLMRDKMKAQVGKSSVVIGDPSLKTDYSRSSLASRRAPVGKKAKPVRPPNNADRTCFFDSTHEMETTSAAKLDQIRFSKQSEYAKPKQVVKDTKNLLCKQPRYREYTTQTHKDFVQPEKQQQGSQADVGTLRSSFTISQEYTGPMTTANKEQFRPYAKPQMRSLAHHKDSRFESNLNKTMQFPERMNTHNMYETTNERFEAKKSSPKRQSSRFKSRVNENF